MRDPEFMRMTTDYRSQAGMWATSKVLLLNQIDQSLGDAAKLENKQAIKAEIDTVPWLANAASHARRKYCQSFQKIDANRKVAPAKPEASDVEARRAKLRKILVAAAAKLKAEAAEKVQNAN